MGVLDDAIREHLELKRTRGADPGEVERQAAEALGPARREPPADPAAEAAAVEGAETAAVEGAEEVPVEAGEQPVADVPAAEPPTQLAEELVPPPPPATEPVVEEEPSAEVTPLRPVEEEPEAEPERFPEAPPPEPPPAEDAAPVEEPSERDEVPAEEQMAPPAGESDESPLDFSEEKRKKRRLWFEQSPGRDFDFDD